MKTIRQKVIAACVAVLVIGLGSAGAGLWVAQSLSDALQRSAQSANLLRSHMSADQAHDALRGDVLTALHARNTALHISMDEVHKDLADHVQIFQTSIKTSNSLASTPELRTVVGQLDAPLAAYIAAAQQIVGVAGRDQAAAEALFPDFSTKFKVLEGAMEAASEKIEAAAQAQAAEAERRTALARGLMMTAMAAAVLFGLGLIVTAFRGVLRPIRELAGDMRSLAGGDLDIALKSADRRDELGEIGRAVREFQGVIVAKAQAEASAAEERRRGEAEVEARDREVREARQAELNRVVDGLGDGLERLAAGDLTCRLNEAFAAEYEKLRADFNGAIDQLQETMKTIVGSTQGIRSGTGEISQAADDLSRRTEQQAASLEETAAALDQITATVRRTAEGAGHARDVVSTAKDDAERSGKVVRDAVAAMSEIEKSSQQISQIIGVIDEIAFQTNLLALNAGVEAARAGEAGRGFAVVASEVRALAQRSADAAKEIKALISASTQQVGAGVELVAETGKSLERIVTQVGEINGIVVEIAASAQEQATGLHQVNTAVNQMDQVTQQNAAMVEQSTAASHALSQETGELARLVGRFQLGANAVETIRPEQRRAAPQAARPALKTTARAGNAVRKSEPAAEEDGWEEF